MVESKVIIENKAKEGVTPRDKAQTLTYLRLSNLKLALIEEEVTTYPYNKDRIYLISRTQETTMP